MGVSAEGAHRHAAPVAHLLQVVGRQALGHERYAVTSCPASISQARWGAGAKRVVLAHDGSKWALAATRSEQSASQVLAEREACTLAALLGRMPAQGAEGRRSRSVVPPALESGKRPRAKRTGPFRASKLALLPAACTPAASLRAPLARARCANAPALLAGHARCLLSHS